MALIKTPICEFGLPAPVFELPSTTGKMFTLEQCSGPNGLLVMFISNHCPYVKAIRKKLVRDCKALIGLGIRSVAIMPNDTENYPEDSLENMARVADEFGFPFPYLIDHSQEVARAYGAVCTPDFFGYNKNLELQYRGRLDAAGAQENAWDEDRELFKAMKQVAETGQGPEEQYPSMGCSIKWRPE
jgi:peroxiredoxin